MARTKTEPLVQYYTKWYSATVKVLDDLEGSLKKIEQVHTLMKALVIDCITYGSIMDLTPAEVVHLFENRARPYFVQFIQLNPHLIS